LKRLIKELRSIFEKNNIKTKLENHNKEMLNANFWQDKANSKKILKEKKLFEDLVQSYQQ
jgi:peptide chain release factor 2